MSEVEEAVVPVEVEEDNPPVFGMSDIVNMVKVLDACCQRGAFRGEEMENIGSFRNRLNDYVEYHKPPAPEEEQGDNNE